MGSSNDATAAEMMRSLAAGTSQWLSASLDHPGPLHQLPKQGVTRLLLAKKEPYSRSGTLKRHVPRSHHTHTTRISPKHPRWSERSYQSRSSPYGTVSNRNFNDSRINRNQRFGGNSTDATHGSTKPGKGASLEVKNKTSQNTVPDAVVKTDEKILADEDGKKQSSPPDVTISTVDENVNVLQYLKSNVIKTGYKPMPDELKEAINELFERNKVEFAVIAQSTGDWRKVTVVGAGVEEAFETDADQYAVIKKYSEFTVTPKNKNVPRQTKHYAGWERPYIWEKRSKCYKDVWEKENWTSCELLVEANEKNKVNNRQAVYAVVPAHLLLTEKQRKEATLDWVYPSAAGNACSAGEDGEPISTIEKARFEVERKTTKRSYSIHWKEGDEDMKTDLSHPALLAYRQWFCKQSNAYLCPIGRCPPVHALCPHMFINDIALLQLDRDDARQLQLTLNEKLQSKAPILDIATNEQLNMLCSGEFQYNIEIKGYTGVTHPKLRPFYPGRVYGKNLAFYITSDVDSAGNPDKLKDGDCGLMVYMKGNDHSRTILGMFIGEYEHQIEGEPVVYQAIILSQALKNIGLDYPHHVNKIRQFTTAGARPPRLQQRRFSSR